MPPTYTTLAAAKLPALGHLTTSEFERIYEPSDDTYLLTDVLSAEADEIRSRQPSLCVELGSGSGAVLAHLGSLLPQNSTALLGIDINPFAAAATQATGVYNSQPIHVSVMDLLSALRPGIVDILVFNPPYVPTSPEELLEAGNARDLSAAWAGGVRGRQVIPSTRRQPSELASHLQHGK